MPFRRLPAIAVGLTIALLLAACTQPVTPAQRGTLTVTLVSASVSALPGDELTVQVSVTRGGGFAGEVAVSSADVPAGVTPPSPVTIAADAADAALTLVLDDDLAAGDLEITIVAAGNGVLDTAALTIDVGELNGRIDTSFGIRGVYAYDVGYSRFEDLILDGDGRLVAVGTTYVGVDLPLIVRLAADGTPDPGFGANGVMTIPALAETTTSAGTVDGSGRIVLAGSNFDTGNCFVARLTTTGALDATFDGDGIAEIVTATFDSCWDVLIDDAGGIVVVGGSDFDDALVARLNDDGSLDATFDADGIATYDPSAGGNEQLRAVLQRGDGSLVGVGSVRAPDALSDFALIGVAPDGSLDAAFGSGGYVATDIDLSRDAATAAGWLDGDVVAVGYTGGGPGGNEDMAVVRYDADGSLDTSFGEGGVVEIDVLGGYDYPNAMTVTAAGSIVVAGYASGSGYNGRRSSGALEQRGPLAQAMAVAVLGGDGALDTSFNKDGVAVLDSLPLSAATGVVVDSDGGIVLAGYGGDGAVVVRLTP